MIDCMINLPTSTVYVMCMYKYCGAGGWSVNGNCNEIKIKDNDRRHRPLSDPIHDYILHGLERHIINIWKTKRHRFMWFNCWPPWSTEECWKHCFFLVKWRKKKRENKTKMLSQKFITKSIYLRTTVIRGFFKKKTCSHWIFQISHFRIHSVATASNENGSWYSIQIISSRPINALPELH